jgi:hypothetical protein
MMQQVQTNREPDADLNRYPNETESKMNNRNIAAELEITRLSNSLHKYAMQLAKDDEVASILAALNDMLIARGYSY